MNALLSALVLLSVLFTTSGPLSVAVSDVPETHPYAIAIGDLVGEGIVDLSATDAYRPDGRIELHDVGDMLCRSMGRFAADWDCAELLRETGSTAHLKPSAALGLIGRTMVAAGLWQEQPDPTGLSDLIAGGTPDFTGVQTYAGAVGFVPGAAEAAPNIDWTRNASRGWFAQALWDALRTTGWVFQVSEAPQEPTGPSGDPDDALVAGELTLSATFASIGIELDFSGDENANASAALEFKPVGTGDWRSGLPLWRTDDGSAPAFFGSALLLNAGTEYDIRITLDDPDGVQGEGIVSGRIATRSESIPQASALTPTHYVSPGGSDTADGRSPATAWKTLNKVMKDAPAGAIVQAAAGYYDAPTVTRTLPITLTAANPAVNDSRAVINPGKHSVIQPATYSSPKGATVGTLTPWRKVTFTGPATGKSFSVWKWTASPVEKADMMAFTSVRANMPKRVAYWKPKNENFGKYNLSTPAGWAEVLYENDTWQYGFTSFGRDIYLRLPGDLNPNAYYVTVLKMADNEMTFDANDVRVTGFELRMVRTVIKAPARNSVFDHNLTGNTDVYFRGDPKTSSYPVGHVVQYNRMLDTGVRSTDPSYPPIAWLFIKQNIKIHGETTPWRRVGETAETHAVDGRGGANELVVRYNTIDGFFNGIGAYAQGFDRYAKHDYDIYGNTITNIADDAIEPEDQTINWRVWNNRVERASVFVSTGPVHYGPVYLFRNEVWKLGKEGVGADRFGDTGVGSYGFKFSGQSSPTARIYVVHNTFWTDANDTNGSLQAAGGGTANESFLMRNNIVRMTRYAFSAPGSEKLWDEDFNFFFTSDSSRGIAYGTQNYKTVRDYRAASDEGDNTNLADGSGAFKTEPGLVDPGAGNLRLSDSSPLVDDGTIVPNISDRPGIDFFGDAPDLGASEVR